ncbi:MAG: HigA family addiction module antitoxin [Proteobacteria bacterium]|nr:HigA family addiction module antitoxin [Pseudomonadota bacterium]
MFGVSRKHLSRFINGHVSISPEFALRLQTFTDKSANAWLNIQNNYDLYKFNDETMKQSRT